MIEGREEGRDGGRKGEKEIEKREKRETFFISFHQCKEAVMCVS